MTIFYVLMFLIGVLIFLGFFAASQILYRKNSPIIAGCVLGIGIICIWSFFEVVGYIYSFNFL